jgi:hypothetical protein
LERKEGVARLEVQAVGAIPQSGLSGDRGRPGMRWFSDLGESLCARAPCNRSPDEAFHEVPTNQSDRHCGGEGILQPSHGLSFREGCETAIAETPTDQFMTAAGHQLKGVCDWIALRSWARTMQRWAWAASRSAKLAKFGKPAGAQCGRGTPSSCHRAAPAVVSAHVHQRRSQHGRHLVGLSTYIRDVLFGLHERDDLIASISMSASIGLAK